MLAWVNCGGVRASLFSQLRMWLCARITRLHVHHQPQNVCETMCMCTQVVLLLDNRERFVQRVGSTALTGAQSRPVHMEQVIALLSLT